MSASLPTRERALGFLLEGGKRRVARVGPQGFVAGHRLLGKERLAAGHPPRDAGIEAGERIDPLDGHVGAVDDDRAAVEQRPPGVGAALGPPLAEAGDDERPVGRGVVGLHRGDHAELLEPRNVGRVEVLGVLDPPAQIAAR